MFKTTDEVLSHYEKLKINYTHQKNNQRNIANQWSWARVFIFLIFSSFSIYFYFIADYFIGNILLAIGIIAFAFSIKKHAKILEKFHFLENLVHINEGEIKVLKGDFSEREMGSKYIEPDHFFANDLDLFGEKSFFQFANRCVTQEGERILADNLKNPLFSSEFIQKKQNSVLILKDLLAFRQDFEAKGKLHKEKENDFAHFQKWLNIPKTLLHKKYVNFILWFNPIVSLILLSIWGIGYLPFGVVGLWGILNLGLVFTQLSIIRERSDSIDNLKKFLRKNINLFEICVNNIDEIAKNPNLQKSDLIHFVNIIQDCKGKKIIENLSTFADNSDNGVSLFGLIFNALLLWNWQVLYRLERHLSIFETKILTLLKELNQIDVLNTWANLAYNNPDTYSFPILSENKFELIGENLSHPLLPPQERIGNPVFFDNFGQLSVITGANMAGKSTYLRTVTLNLLLAMQGAVICGKKLTFTPILIYTSMRTKDSLASRESFFYAEIKRLKQLLDRLDGNQKIFVVLDEILKGTNSADQHSGAKALLTQLVKKNAIGLIATHDLSLGEWAKQYPQHFKNQCFEIHISNNHLRFTYQLQDGINKNLNATFLLEQMGIKEIEMR